MSMANNTYLLHLFRFIYYFNSTVQSHSIIWFIDTTLSLVQFVILSIINLMSHFQLTQKNWKQFSIVFFQVVGLGKQSDIFHSIILTVMGLIFVIALIIYIYVNKCLSAKFIFQQNKSKNKLVITGITLIILIIEITMIIRVIRFGKKIADLLNLNSLLTLDQITTNTEKHLLLTIQLITSSLILLLVGFLSKNFRISWTIKIIFPLLVIFYETIISTSYLMVLSILLFLFQKYLIHKIAYATLGFLSLWGFIQLLYLKNVQQQKNQNGAIDLIFVGFGAISIILILIIKKLEIFKLFSDDEDQQFTKKIINKLCVKQINQLNQQELMRCQLIITKFQIKENQKCQFFIQKQSQIYKSVTKFSRIDFLLFFYRKIIEEVKFSKKINKILIQLKLQILLLIYKEQKNEVVESLNINIIKCIRSFIETLIQKQYSFSQQYEFFVFEKQIIQKIKILNGEQNNESMALKVIKTSNQSEKIFELLGQVLDQLQSFWKTMRRNTILQQNLNKIVLQIQKKKIKIQSKLKNLQFLYPSKQQRYTFQLVCSLISRVYKRDSQILNIQKSNSQYLKQKNSMKQISSKSQRFKQETKDKSNNYSRQNSDFSKKRSIKSFATIRNNRRKFFEQQQSTKKEQENQIIQLSYLIVSNQIIKDASKKLLEDLKFNIQEITEIKLNNLFLKGFEQILINFQQNLFKRSQLLIQKQQKSKQLKQSLILPLIDKNGFILIYNCKIFFIPKFQDGLSILYSLQRANQFSNTLMCNAKNQTGIAVSQKFVQTFFNGQKSFLKQNQFHLKDEVGYSSKMLQFSLQKYLKQFNLQKSEVLNEIKSSLGFSCNLITQNRGKSKLFQIKVKCLQKYCLKHQELMLMQISKNKRIKVEQSSIEDENKKTIVLSDTRNKQIIRQFGQNLINDNFEQLKERFKQQKFFCPIENTYGLKIQEKQQFLKQSNRINYPFYLLLLIIMWTISYIIYLSVYMSTRFQEINILKESYNILDKNNVVYQHLLNSYYNSYLLYHIKNSANQEIFQPYKINYQDSLVFHRQKLNQKIIAFSKMYLSSHNSPYVSQNIIFYTLHFQNFDVKMNTSLTGLLDLVVKLKTTEYGNNDTSIKFLLQNLHQVEKAKFSFKGIPQYIFIIFSEQKSWLQNIGYFFTISHFRQIFGFTTAFSVMVIWFIVILFKVQNILKSTCNLLTLSNESQINKILFDINQCKKKLSYKQIHKQQSSSSLFKNQDQTIFQNQKQAKGHQTEDVQKIKKIQCQNIISVVSQYRLFFLVVLFTISLFAYHIFDILKSGKQYKDIATYKQVVYDAHEDYLQQMAQKYGSLIERYLNFTINTSHDPYFSQFSSRNGRQLLTDFQRNLPQNFNSYYDVQNKYSTGNLCQLFKIQGKLDPLFSTVACKTVIKGILEQGLARSMELFRDAMKSETAPGQNFLESFIDFNRDNQSNFLKMLYCYQRLNMVYSKLQNELTTEVQEYLNLKNQNIKFENLYLMAISIVILGVWLGSYLRLKQRCHTCLLYFSIIPKQIIYGRKSTFFMQKNKYLELLNNM